MSRIHKTLFVFLILNLCTIFSAHAMPLIDALLHHANDPIAGNPRGKITIVEFFDYQCSHCAEMAPVMHDIIKANPDVRVVFKEFPIRGAVSDEASLAALAANKQGKYIEFNHALLSSSQSLSEENVLETAQSVGLNMNRLKKDMADSSLKKQLQNNRDLAQALKLTGTPAFFIGKTNAKDQNELYFILGETKQSDMQAAIDKAR